MRRRVATSLIAGLILTFCFQRAPSSDSTGETFDAVVPTADIADGVIAEGTILVVTGKPGSVLQVSCFGEISVRRTIAIDPDGGGAESTQLGFGWTDSVNPRPGSRYIVIAVSEETCYAQL